MAGIRSRKWRVAALGVLVFLGAAALAGGARAAGPTEIVVFGDSLSDTGNFFLYSSLRPDVFPRPVPPAPLYWEGRFSNGPVWVEVLADALDLPRPEASLAGGTNNAWGGAETGFGPSFQLSPNVGEQVADYLAAAQPTGDELFVLWAGANDVNNVKQGARPDPETMAENLATHVRTLAAAMPKGRRLHLLVVNLPPLGDTVRARWLGKDVPWFPGYLNAVSQGFNALLAQKLTALTTEVGNVDLHLFDAYTLLGEILSRPEDFGFVNATDTARISVDPDGVPPNVSSPGSDVVDDPDGYVFFDDVHPTRAAHRVLGTAAVAAVAEPVAIDLKPGSTPNCINLGSHGVVPVAVFADEAGRLDVDPWSLRLAGLPVALKPNGQPQCAYEDRNGDGHPDLVCKFRTSEEDWYAFDHTAYLTGRRTDGTPIVGWDEFCLVP